jgi:hypothetical protein
VYQLSGKTCTVGASLQLRPSARPRSLAAASACLGKPSIWDTAAHGSSLIATNELRSSANSTVMKGKEPHYTLFRYLWDKALGRPG